MKHILPFALCFLLLWSCKKEMGTASPEDYLTKVKEGLKDSMSAEGFQQLDFSRALVNRVDSIDLYVVRVPFKAKPIGEDFVAVKTDREGRVQRGRVVHMKLTTTTDSSNTVTSRKINGAIVMYSLQGKEELASPIKNGYVTAFHQDEKQRTNLEMAPDVLPEVIITYVRHLSGGISFSAWCMVQSFFMDAGGGSWGNYYGSIDGGGGSSNTGGGSTGSGNPYGGGSSYSETILVDRETQDENPAIDIQKYINCFNAVLDAGATCSIEIFSDIPVDNDPNAFFNFSTGSPGHTFIRISKSNGSAHATQNIGFYPTPGYKAITFIPTFGKLVNNAGHEFNASLSMNITPAQLSTALTKLVQQSSQSYDLADYNCTDWALAIFNSVRTIPLDIPRFPVVGMYGVSNASTPQGLYQKLQQMKSNNDPEKGNITSGIIKGYAGGSSGPCN